ncbi:MAG: hypothetical protein KF686_13450 [Ramlibacter sp.]|nr:hypothetical protein [Ramlibacter sp.]
MAFTSAPKFIATCVLLAWTTSTFAHEGHGLSGAHWHSTDVWGFLAAGAAVALAAWFGGRGK